MKDPNMTMLVVEDDSTDVLLLRQAFFKAGIVGSLESVGDGAEAVEYLLGKGEFRDRWRHPMPEVILLDLKMPRMDGFELLRWLGEHQEFSEIPVLVLSTEP